MLRDQISGVSLDEEGSDAHAFSALVRSQARFFQVDDRALEMLMSLAGR
jgi:hypothetical protein